MKNNDINENDCCDILHSIALEETALSHILNAEGEKIQKAVAISKNIDDLLCVNQSVMSTIRDVTSLEIVLLNKLLAITDNKSCQSQCTDPSRCYGKICVSVCSCNDNIPIVDANVSIFYKDIFICGGHTDCDGKFCSSKLLIGKYTVKIDYKGVNFDTLCVEIKRKGCKSVSVCINECHPPISYIDICGTIYDELGNPIKGITLHAEGTEMICTVTDECGKYEISNLPVSNCFKLTPKQGNYVGLTYSVLNPNQCEYIIDIQSNC